jgi:hypothetical protein
MKRTRYVPWAFAFALLLRATCVADVVSIRLAHVRHLQFEPVVLFVTVKNDSDDIIVFPERKNDGDAALDFVIDTGPTEWVRRKVDGPMTGKVRIMPGDQSEIMVELSRWFDLTAMGTYLLRAVVTFGGESFESAPVRFEVDNGLPVAKVSRRPPETGARLRTYSLRYLSRESFDRLFLRVDEDETGDNYGAFEMGPFMRVQKPEIKVDVDGVITVLHLSGIDRWTRTVFKTRNGRVEFVSQAYELSDGRPYTKGPEQVKNNVLTSGKKRE